MEVNMKKQDEKQRRHAEEERENNEGVKDVKD